MHVQQGLFLSTTNNLYATLFMGIHALSSNDHIVCQALDLLVVAIANETFYSDLLLSELRKCHF
jgi:hypothetical protein